MLFKRLDAENEVKSVFSMERIGTNIMKCRKAAGMTQMELADRMGISFQAVSNWERGLSCPDISKLSELSELFKVTIDEILGNNRAVEIISSIENNIPDVKMNELKEVAPLLTEKQIDNVVKKYNHIDIGELVSVAPFLSQKFIDTVAKETYEEKGIHGIVRIAPFVSESLLTSFAEQTHEKGGLSSITSILPFLNQSFVDNLAQSIYEEKGLSEIARIAPFMSDNLLNAIAKQRLEEEGLSGITPIMPFIDNKMIEDYILQKNRNKQAEDE